MAARVHKAEYRGDANYVTEERLKQAVKNLLLDLNAKKGFCLRPSDFDGLDLVAEDAYELRDWKPAYRQIIDKEMARYGVAVGSQNSSSTFRIVAIGKNTYFDKRHELVEPELVKLVPNLMKL